jgi:hypothetical protein
MSPQRKNLGAPGCELLCGQCSAKKQNDQEQIPLHYLNLKNSIIAGISRKLIIAMLLS